MSERGALRGRATNNAFSYDGLDCLLSHSLVTGMGGTVNVTYDEKGNITSKSDVGTYAYDPTKKHALTGVSGGPLGSQSYNYDANGNMISGGGRTITWTSFNQARSITQGSFTSTFSFGANRERVKQVSHLETTIYVGGVFERVTPVGAGAVVEYKHYILAPTGRVAVHTDRSNFQRDVKFYHTDGLGSITAVTDEKGAIVKRFAFDAWGKRINPATGATITGATASGITRGYTDHEHLTDLGLVHMNGRVYDPVLARFISADPFIDGADDAQGFNRYSYVGNNPLNATDPSGFFSLKDGLKIAAIIVASVITAGAAVWAVGVLGGQALTLGTALNAIAGVGGVKLTLAGAIAAGAGAGFGSSFASSLLNGGSLGDAFKAGLTGAIAGGITGGLTYGIGSLYEAGKIGKFSRALLHGSVQGVSAEAQGGQFRHGFYAGFATASASSRIGKIDNSVGQFIAAATVGGTAAAIGGGKFANGAVSAAFQYLLNDLQHDLRTYHSDRGKTAWDLYLESWGDTFRRVARAFRESFDVSGTTEIKIGGGLKELHILGLAEITADVRAGMFMNVNKDGSSELLFGGKYSAKLDFFGLWGESKAGFEYGVDDKLRVVDRTFSPLDTTGGYKNLSFDGVLSGSINSPIMNIDFKLDFVKFDSIIRGKQ